MILTALRDFWHLGFLLYFSFQQLLPGTLASLALPLLYALCFISPQTMGHEFKSLIHLLLAIFGGLIIPTLPSCETRKLSLSGREKG